MRAVARGRRSNQGDVMSSTAGRVPRPDWQACIEQYLVERRSRVLALMLLGISLLYTFAYLSHESAPGNNLQHPKGWNGWWDQGRYLDAAVEFSRLGLDREEIWYPPGYSAIGAIFAEAMPAHAFFFPNLLFVCLITYLAWSIYCRLGSTLIGTALTIGLLVLHSGVWVKSFVIPWNTTPICAAWLAVVRLLVVERVTRGSLIASSCIAGLALWIRPLDAALMAPLLVYGTVKLGTLKAILRDGAIGASIVAVSAIAYRMFVLKVYGAPKTPYEEISAGIGMFGFPFYTKIWMLLYSGVPVFRELRPMFLMEFFWIPLALSTGVLAWFRGDRRPFFGLLGGLLLVAVYLNYNDLWPHNFWTYHLIHYVSWGAFLFALPLAWLLRSPKLLTNAAVALLGALLLYLPLGFFGVRDRMVASTAASGAGESTLQIAGRFNLAVFPGVPETQLREAVLFDGDVALSRFTDYIVFDRQGSAAFLFRGGVRERSLRIVGGKAASGSLQVELREADLGMRAPRVRARPVAAELNIQRMPIDYRHSLLREISGAPEDVGFLRIQVDSPGFDLSSFGNWEVDTDAGNWNQTSGGQRLWRVFATSHGQSLIELEIPDAGGFGNATYVSVTASDREGRRVVVARESLKSP